jgi:hypothetical protein
MLLDQSLVCQVLYLRYDARRPLSRRI